MPSIDWRKSRSSFRAHVVKVGLVQQWFASPRTRSTPVPTSAEIPTPAREGFPLPMSFFKPLPSHRGHVHNNSPVVLSVPFCRRPSQLLLQLIMRLYSRISETRAIPHVVIESPWSLMTKFTGRDLCSRHHLKCRRTDRMPRSNRKSVGCQVSMTSHLRPLLSQQINDLTDSFIPWAHKFPRVRDTG